MAIMISHGTNELIVYQKAIFEVQATAAVQVKGIYLRQNSTGSQETQHCTSDKEQGNLEILSTENTGRLLVA
jgi:hypothetical protein